MGELCRHCKILALKADINKMLGEEKDEKYSKYTVDKDQKRGRPRKHAKNPLDKDETQFSKNADLVNKIDKMSPSEAKEFMNNEVVDLSLGDNQDRSNSDLDSLTDEQYMKEWGMTKEEAVAQYNENVKESEQYDKDYKESQEASGNYPLVTNDEGIQYSESGDPDDEEFWGNIAEANKKWNADDKRIKEIEDILHKIGKIPKEGLRDDEIEYRRELGKELVELQSEKEYDGWEFSEVEELEHVYTEIADIMSTHSPNADPNHIRSEMSRVMEDPGMFLGEVMHDMSGLKDDILMNRDILANANMEEDDLAQLSEFSTELARDTKEYKRYLDLENALRIAMDVKHALGIKSQIDQIEKQVFLKTANSYYYG